MYSVVQFDDGICAIPSSWYKDKKCAWPTSKKNVKKYIERKIPYNELEFKKIKARLLSKNIGSLLEAREKAKEESDFSDFKLNDFEKKRKVEQMANQRHPNKNKIKKSSPPVYASSTKSSSEIDDTDDDSTFTLKRRESISSNHSSTQSNNAMDAIVQKFDDPIPKNIDSIIISQSDDLNFVSTSIDRSSKSTKGQAGILRSIYDNELNNDLIIPPALLPKKTVVLEKNEEIMTKMSSQISQLYRQVTNMSYDIRRVLEAVDRFEDKLNASRNQNVTNDSFYQQFTIEYISNMDSLNLVEQKIINHESLYPDYRNQLIYSLSKQTGKTIKQSVKRIFQKLFHDDILCRFSYHGIRKKNPFSTLNICAVILESIKKDSKYAEVQLNDIEDCIKIYLSQAPFRLQREQQKYNISSTSK